VVSEVLEQLDTDVRCPIWCGESKSFTFRSHRENYFKWLPQIKFPIISGDDSSIVVTIRGGPEEQLTSSYLQIVSVTPRVQGMYFCIGINNEGTAQTVAFVSVYNKFTGIETEK